MAQSHVVLMSTSVWKWALERVAVFRTRSESSRLSTWCFSSNPTAAIWRIGVDLWSMKPKERKNNGMVKGSDVTLEVVRAVPNLTSSLTWSDVGWTRAPPSLCFWTHLAPFLLQPGESTDIFFLSVWLKEKRKKWHVSLKLWFSDVFHANSWKDGVQSWLKL